MQLPEGMANYRQFIVWAAEPEPAKPGKTKKYAVNSRGFEVSAVDPSNWMSFAEAQAAADALVLQGARVVKGIERPAQTTKGVGFVFTEQDPFFFFDIDGAAQDGQWSTLATQMYQAFHGCYFEVSQSGTGMHIIGSARTDGNHGHKNVALGLELYTRLRFCALTGFHSAGNALTNAQAAFDWLVSGYFPAGAKVEMDGWTDEPVPEWSGPEDDDELIQRMLSSRPSAAAAFGLRATVQDLWEANEDVLGKVWPPDASSSYPFDHSHADAALCTHLAFWTGKNCERIKRLFERSGLMRDKWADRPGYAQDTIRKGVAFCNSVLGSNAGTGPTRTSEQAPEPESVAPSPVMALDPEGLRSGFQYLGVTSQQTHFHGCCYVRDLNVIFCPDGSLLDSSRFQNTYGGYIFALDNCGEKTSKNAWEVFTQSQGYTFPRAHSTCFRPEHAPGERIEEEGWVLVNTFVPVETRRVAGDPSPLLNHLAKMLPDPSDRAILLAYMAAVVQHPGKKFQWAPLIQGTKGNGKSMLGDILSYAVGNRWTARPDPEDINNKFNAWLRGAALVIVDEAYVADRRDMETCLKRIITGKRIALQGKGQDQYTGDNRANLFLNSNFKNAVRIDDDERRFAVFFTAQQSAEDINRDGMGGRYFPDLIAWLEADGYAVMNDYLRRYQIPDELNPATLCHRAPVTSATPEAIRVSRGQVEQEVMEAIEECRPGFSGGWISSLALDQLLENKRMAAKVPRCNRKDLVWALGYDWHPALRDGRVASMVACPAAPGKPRLYLKRGHVLMALRTEAEVIKHYLAAQSGSTPAAEAFGLVAGGVA
jgi:hypothetical protein